MASRAETAASCPVGGRLSRMNIQSKAGEQENDGGQREDDADDQACDRQALAIF